MVRQLKKSKSSLVRMLSAMGGYRVARWLVRHRPRILMYHRFCAEPKRGYMDVAALRSQLAQLKKEFNVVPLADVAKALNEGKALPEHAIVLTVDDGYRDFYRYAFPEFKAANVPVSFFVTSGFVDGKTWLWPDMLSDLLEHVSPATAQWPESTPEHLTQELSRCTEKRSAWHHLNRFLMPMDLAAKFQWLQQAAAMNGHEINEHAPPHYEAVSWQELKEMADSGVVDVGAHTVMHPTLSGISLPQAIEEVKQSKARLEQQLGIEVKHFCYPNGQPEDFTPQVASAVADAGFDCAVAAHCYYVTFHDTFALPRFSVTTNPFQFNKIVYGVQWLSKRLTQSGQLKRIKELQS
ncbi:polysaccharide deacetylase family protein [Corallincola platygyrae]|uniref:Polysaccharide deacetylase family protein n=1 Tax=Corallincola platygyrae TaxID=1193278 RepID=A0ABW4XL45_9GAMM